MELGQKRGGRGRRSREGGGERVEIGGVLGEVSVVGPGEDGRETTRHVQVNKWVDCKTVKEQLENDHTTVFLGQEGVCMYVSGKHISRVCMWYDNCFWRCTHPFFGAQSHE